MEEKQRETEKFVGCLLSVKTKMGQFGVQHIIGTVREVDVSSAEPAIVLDQAICNGVCLPDGFVLLSSQIADLTVLDKEKENANTKSASSSRNQLNPEADDEEGLCDSPIVNNSIEHSASGFHLTNHQQISESRTLGYSNGSDSSARKNSATSSATQQINGSVSLMNSITTAMADVALKNNISESEDNNEANGGHILAKPKPRKVTNKNNSNGAIASTPTSVLSSSQKSLTAHKQPTNNSSTENRKRSTNVCLSSSKSQASNSNDGGDILLRTFVGGFSKSGSATATKATAAGGTTTTVALNGQDLFNAVTAGSFPAGIKSTAAVLVPGGNKIKPNTNHKNTQSPSKPIMYDHKKLGVLSQFVNLEGNSDESQQQLTPQKNKNNSQSDSKALKSHGKGNGRQQQQRRGETFEMTKDEMSADFDFEGSNAQFEKLPVTGSNKPTKVTKQPQFCTTDTTYLADRCVESITMREGIASKKQFVTDTGVAIPAVDLSTRSKILNLAHAAGLTHSRVVEVMGRAVAQAVIPLLGDSYRLSPERTEDRPWVLVCAGPHWQGAIGISAARILASLGVHTCVHAPNEELQLCRVEEILYTMSGETLTRKIKDLKGYQFDLVIMAMDDHLSRSLTLSPYAEWLKTAAVVLVDPPLISSYRHHMDVVCGGNQKGRKIVIISPVLPITYPSDASVKLFLVNLGIPKDIFEENGVCYQSPFGDKLVIQIFGGSPK